MACLEVKTWAREYRNSIGILLEKKKQEETDAGQAMNKIVLWDTKLIRHETCPKRAFFLLKEIKTCVLIKL